MDGAIIKILDVIQIPGRKDSLVVFEFSRGSTSDFMRSTVFTARNSSDTWRLTSLAHSDPPLNNGRDSAGFVQITGTAKLNRGMELVQADAGEVQNDEVLESRAKFA